jgi:DtxR family transcriptional regulator, Mn-dependent transcriptional regulator
MPAISHAIEDYLKAIYELAREEGRASTSALSERLGVKPASVTGMLQKLADPDEAVADERPVLVNYARHHGASLTEAGQKIALQVIRHHRLIELYLSEALGYDWDRVHGEAEQLEHVISEEFEERISAYLGDPKRDPHGDPIPAKDGTVEEVGRTTLSEMEAGQSGRVARVRDDDPALLRYLGELGLVPNATVTVDKRAPFDGPLHVRVGGSRSPSHALGREVTDRVFVDIAPSKE